MKSNTKNVAAHGNGSNNEANTATPQKKGKQHANLRKNGMLRFQMGLILAMFLVYIGLEASFKMYKQYTPEVEYELDQAAIYYPEEIILLKEKPIEKIVKPSKPVVDLEKLKISKDDELDAIEEKFIEKISIPEGNGNPDPGLITDIDPRDGIVEDVDFIVVEDVPIFPGCEKVEKEEQRACFQKKMQNHVRKHVRYPEVEKELGIQGKVYVLFKIDIDGTITDIQMRGPNDNLEKEASRIIGKLPQMLPGKQRGKPVRVPFSLPITFKLQ